MKIKSLEVLNAVTIPGAIGGDISINQSKQPGVEIELLSNCVKVEYKGKTGLIPLSNIRQMVIDE